LISIFLNLRLPQVGQKRYFQQFRRLPQVEKVPSQLWVFFDLRLDKKEKKRKKKRRGRKEEKKRRRSFSHTLFGYYLVLSLLNLDDLFDVSLSATT